VHLGVREMQAVFMKVVTKQKNEKRRYLIDVQFFTDNKLATAQDHQTLQNSDEKQDCQYWILRLDVFARFPATEIAC